MGLNTVRRNANFAQTPILPILHFVWEDQSEKVCCIDHKVVINCVTVLYSTVMRLIGHIQHCYALN